MLLLLLLSAPLLHAAKWTYSGPQGEHHWSQHFPYCGGAFQSPIDITSDLLRFDPALGPIVVQNYNLFPSEQLTLGNNGHSVQISLPPKMHISSLPHRYSAAQLHFHWGSAGRLMGSEHMVNSRQYAGESCPFRMAKPSFELTVGLRVSVVWGLKEQTIIHWFPPPLKGVAVCWCSSMHVVHFNSDKYPNISMAVDKLDGLAVLGVFIEIGEFSPVFEQFLKFLNGIKYRDQKVQVPGFNIRNLLPSRLDEYYRYDGSLTTPPCYPSVLWTLFRNPVTVSRKQFLSLATALFSSHAQDSTPVPLNGNFRKPQLADSRVVLVSFKEDQLFWMKRGLFVPVLVGSALGLAFIVSFMCCLIRRKRSRAEKTKRKGSGYNAGERAEYDTAV